MKREAIRDDGGRMLLIRKALELLNEVHPEDLSIREVTRLTELSSGAPYHHFKTKTDLLAACAVLAWTELCVQLEDDGGNGVQEQLLRRATTYLAYARANPGPYRLITSRLFENSRSFPEIGEQRARAMGGVISLIMAATKPTLDRKSAKFLGLCMWSMLHGHLILNHEPSEMFDSLPSLDRDVAIHSVNTALHEAKLRAQVN